MLDRSSGLGPLTKVALGLGLTTAGGIALAGLVPLPTHDLISHPNPATSYADACDRLAQLQAADTDEVNPICRSNLLTHGHTTDHAAVLLHGFGNCPQSWSQFAPMLFERGYNVLIPRMPYNGFRDRETDAPKNLTPRLLREYCDTVIDIAQGLGKRVTVFGISAGAVLTTWVAQERADVDCAVMIATALGTTRIPQALATFAMNLLMRAPNIQLWIHPIQKADWSGPPHNYLQHSSRGFSAVMVIGSFVFSTSQQRAPGARSVVVVTNANDKGVDNDRTMKLVERWQQHGLAHVRTHEFPEHLGLGHECIDPYGPDQHVDIVYPVLLDLATNEEWRGVGKG